jgi:hypothetical protein
MPDEQVQQQEQHLSYTNVKAPDFRSIYSNNVTFSVALFDFSMVFGEVIEAEQVSETIGKLTVEQKVKIIMSPLHAKIFVQMAAVQLRAYEQRFGEIKFPPGSLVPEATAASDSPKPKGE